MKKEHYKYIDGTGYFDGEYVLSREREIERLSKEVTMYDELLCNRNNEIDRLNNIINGLEKGIKENIEELEEHQLSRDRIYEDKEILRFLQELKGEDKE